MHGALGKKNGANSTGARVWIPQGRLRLHGRQNDLIIIYIDQGVRWRPYRKRPDTIYYWTLLKYTLLMNMRTYVYIYVLMFVYIYTQTEKVEMHIFLYIHM